MYCKGLRSLIPHRIPHVEPSAYQNSPQYFLFLAEHLQGWRVIPFTIPLGLFKISEKMRPEDPARSSLEYVLIFFDDEHA